MGIFFHHSIGSGSQKKMRFSHFEKYIFLTIFVQITDLFILIRHLIIPVLLTLVTHDAWPYAEAPGEQKGVGLSHEMTVTAKNWSKKRHISKCENSDIFQEPIE